MEFDVDFDDDGGTDPYYLSTDIVLGDNFPLYTYAEIFHGKD